jgi:small neutral amino acid transporter SnatA (MarC family)
VTLAFLGLLAAVNPAAASLALVRDRRTDRPASVVAGTVAAAAVLAVLAAAADPVLDALDVELGTYRLGAGVVVAAAGVRWLVMGAIPPVEEPENDRRLAGFVAFPVLVTPAAAALALSVGAEHGTVRTAVAAGVAVVLGGVGIYVRRSIPHLLALGLVRLFGAAAAVIGVIVAVDGVRTLY